MPEITTRLVTYKDMIDHAVEYLGINITGDAARDGRRAVQNAYRQLATMRNWSIYYRRGRVTTLASQTTGTIAYDDTGGTYENMVTISGSSFPSWAPYGTLLIGRVPYEIQEVKTATVATLSVNSNPGQDLAAGTAYTLYRDTYPMPIDFQAVDKLVMPSNLYAMKYVHPSRWLLDQQGLPSVGIPRYYTVMSDPNYYGTLAIRMSPAPSTSMTYDYIYKRTPRPLLLDEKKVGTASCVNASAVITGTGTQWKSDYVGSIIRLSADKTNLPTGLSGTNPFEVQRVIVSVESETSLTVDRVVAQTLTGVKHTISDPVDIEETMLNALLRCIEKELRISRRMKPVPEDELRYREAIALAFEADSRNFASREVEPYAFVNTLPPAEYIR